MLQDLRHILILDFRPEEEFKASHIRKSLNVTSAGYADVLLKAIGAKHCKSHYEGDHIKRVLFVLPSEEAK